MSQSHATDEFHSRHLSTLVSDSVEQYMGHFQYNQNMLLERLARLESATKSQLVTITSPAKETSPQLTTNATTPPSSGNYYIIRQLIWCFWALTLGNLTSTDSPPSPDYQAYKQRSGHVDCREDSSKRPRENDTTCNQETDSPQSTTTIHVDLGFINSMVPFRKEGEDELKPLAPEGLEKFYSANATSPLLATGYSKLPAPLADQSKGPQQGPYSYVMYVYLRDKETD